jgi:meso-butanediol dehydrogenase/(S,S)-butanediol dehydrogenase/diacetyl reductase
MTARTEIAIITGAGSGIGAEVALRLAARGASVALLDYSAEGLASTKIQLDKVGATALSVTVDVRDAIGVGRAVELVQRDLGTITTVVACAGVEVLGDVTTLELSEWERAISINLTGVFNLARQTIPVLVTAGGGSFTAIASDAGVQGAQGYAAYCASKHGVVGLIRCLALDHGGQGVRSNVVCPSMVDTPMATRIMGDVGGEDFYTATVPLGRFARPTEIASAVAHLSSSEASYVNGQVYMIDGGATAGYYEGPGKSAT